MQLFALVLAIAAAVVFFVDWSRSTRANLVALGLALLSVAWIVQLVFAGTLIRSGG